MDWTDPGRPFVTDGGHYTADCKFEKIADPASLEAQIKHIPGALESGLFVGLAGAAQRRMARLKLGFELGRVEAPGQHLRAGQFVDHVRMLQQVAGRPFGGRQQAQQAVLHHRALDQQRQVAVAAQQRLDPVGPAQRGFHRARLAVLVGLAQPLAGRHSVVPAQGMGC